MQRNGFLSEDTDELLDEVTALVDKMDSSLPLHPLFQPNGFTASQPNAIAAGETLQLNDCASSSHYNNRVDVSIIPCQVCGDRTSGTHYGVLTCEGCKGFFRRFRARAAAHTPTCHKDNACVITKDTRNRCQACRYRKCLKAGMHKDNVKFGRKSKQDLAQLRRQAAYCTKFRNGEYQFSASDQSHHSANQPPDSSSYGSQFSTERVGRNLSRYHRGTVTGFCSDPSLDSYDQERQWPECEFYKSNSHNGVMEHQQIVPVKAEEVDNIDYWTQINNYKPALLETDHQFTHHTVPVTTVHFSYPPTCTALVSSSYSSFATPSLSFNRGYSQSSNSHFSQRPLPQKSQSVRMGMIGIEKQNELVRSSEFPTPSSTLTEECVDGAFVFSRGFQC